MSHRAPAISRGVSAFIWGLVFGLYIWLGRLASGERRDLIRLRCRRGLPIFLLVRLYGADEPAVRRAPRPDERADSPRERIPGDASARLRASRVDARTRGFWPARPASRRSGRAGDRAVLACGCRGRRSCGQVSVAAEPASSLPGGRNRRSSAEKLVVALRRRAGRDSLAIVDDAVVTALHGRRQRRSRSPGRDRSCAPTPAERAVCGGCRRVECEAEDEPEAEREHGQRTGQIVDESADRDVLRPVDDVIAEPVGSGCPASSTQPAATSTGTKPTRKTPAESRGHPHFVQPPKSCDSAIVRPAPATSP